MRHTKIIPLMALTASLLACDLPEAGECLPVDETQSALLSTCYEFNLPASQFDFDGTCDDWCSEKEQGPAAYTLTLPEGAECSQDFNAYTLEPPDAKHEGLARCVCECAP